MKVLEPWMTVATRAQPNGGWAQVLDFKNIKKENEMVMSVVTRGLW
jgi:hypothetical protein